MDKMMDTLCKDCVIIYRSLGGQIPFRRLCNDCKLMLITNIKANEQVEEQE